MKQNWIKFHDIAMVNVTDKYLKNVSHYDLCTVIVVTILFILIVVISNITIITQNVYVADEFRLKTIIL